MATITVKAVSALELLAAPLAARQGAAEAAAGELGVSIRAPRLPSVRFAAQSAAAVDRAGKAGCGVAPSGDWNDIGEQAAEIVDMIAQGTNSRSSIHATLRAWPSWPTPLRQQAAKLG